jgi:hypothetical protein
MDSLYIGGVMFVTGFILTTYHASKLFASKDKIFQHLAWAMVGVGLFQIGSNLTANGLHDCIKNK